MVILYTCHQFGNQELTEVLKKSNRLWVVFCMVLGGRVSCLVLFAPIVDCINFYDDIVVGASVLCFNGDCLQDTALETKWYISGEQ
jgi:hypothetical protein